MSIGESMFGRAGSILTTKNGCQLALQFNVEDVVVADNRYESPLESETRFDMRVWTMAGAVLLLAGCLASAPDNRDAGDDDLDRAPGNIQLSGLTYQVGHAADWQGVQSLNSGESI